ncbi:hypothetical protein JTB14_025427 [Gonioctena quinquepunctata]|nr:hypothetical protein JTB14_025427 [Gonioctena quinquepunctata]
MTSVVNIELLYIRMMIPNLAANEVQDEEPYELEKQVIQEATDWFNANGLSVNRSKTQSVMSSLSHNPLHSLKCLGITIDSKLSWKPDIDKLANNLSNKVYAIRQIK